MKHNVAVNFGGPVGGPNAFINVEVDIKYTPSCYDYAGRLFIEAWDWLCDASPTDRSFRIHDVMRGCAVFTNKDQLAAFIHICCALAPGDHLERVGLGIYRWVFADARLRECSDTPLVVINEK